MKKGKKGKKGKNCAKWRRAPSPLFPSLPSSLPHWTELKHPVHGYFIYECERCGTVYQMYLDRGLEDSVRDALYPKEHKPVPFAIMCKECAKVAETLGREKPYGFCRHILWGIGDSDTYTELPEGASYFRNDPKEPHGIPVYNISYRNKEEWLRSQLGGVLSNGNG